MGIVTIEDFTGNYLLPVNEFDSSKTQDEITKQEKRILVNTIGIEMYNDFVSDFEAGFGVPTQERWLNFLNGKIYPTSENATIKVEYEGCKSFLVPMIFGVLMRDQLFVSDVGFVDAKTEGTKKANVMRTKNKADRGYNDGVCERQKCLWFLMEFDSDYPDFEYYFSDYSARATYAIKGLRS